MLAVGARLTRVDYDRCIAITVSLPQTRPAAAGVMVAARSSLEQLEPCSEPLFISRSARLAEHWKNWRRRSHLNSAQQLKPEPFIERYILGVAGFEVSQRAITIARDKRVFH